MATSNPPAGPPARPSVTFWGVRGSIPCPGPGTVRYGGNTASLAVEHPDGDLVILDGGTGLRPLGLMLRDRGPLDADLLLTHTHWDHIQGLPFFQPLYDPESRIRIHGPRQSGGLQGVLERQMTWENFPIPPSAQTGIESVIEREGGTFAVAGWTARAFGLCHAGHTLGYRLDRPGVPALAYVTDNELAGNAHGVGPGWRNGLVDFLQGVDLLVHDTTWPETRLAEVAGWGHSSPAQAVTLARDAGCRTLVLFHHNPEFDDRAMDRHLAGAQAAARGLAPDLLVRAAVEGETIMLGSDG